MNAPDENLEDNEASADSNFNREDIPAEPDQAAGGAVAGRNNSNAAENGSLPATSLNRDSNTGARNN